MARVITLELWEGTSAVSQLVEGREVWACDECPWSPLAAPPAQQDALNTRKALEQHKAGMHRFSVRENLLAVIGAEVAAGLNLEQLTKLQRLHSIFDTAADGDIVTLEDSEYEALNQQLQQIRITRFSPFVGRFVTLVNDAPVLDLSTEKKPPGQHK